MEEEESLFEENDIINKEYYNGIKNMINCSICLNIIEDPLQCNKCQKFFCSKCIKNTNNCPFRCINNEYVSSLTCKALLSELKIKCKCGKEFKYDFIKKHKNEECELIDFKKKYFEYKKKYELLLKEQNENNDKIENDAFIKTSLHKHPVELIRRVIMNWICNICRKHFDMEIPSYHCTICDYDLCYNCVKNKIIKGEIREEMKYFYNEFIEFDD